MVAGYTDAATIVLLRQIQDKLIAMARPLIGTELGTQASNE
jgi:hypothetical protein